MVTTDRRLSIGGLVTLVGLLALALLSASSAMAAKKPISGQLSKPDYTVLAVAKSGKARSDRTPNGKFAIRPPAKRVTLQLRGSDGIYAGPVVIAKAKRGKEAVLGLGSGAKLGKVKVDAAKGYAKLAKRPPAKYVETDIWARAKKGVPIGAGKFGRVKSKKTKGGAPGDFDLDGIPNVLDVDDDGDLTLDSVDRSSGRASARAARVGEGGGPGFGTPSFVFSSLTAYMETTANANATDLSTAQMDALLSSHGDLLLAELPGDELPNSPELDCGGSIQEPPRPEGLIYCRPHSAGGIGTVGRYPPISNEVAFPDERDPDDDGLGTITATVGPAGSRGAMFLHHHATTEQIGTGDLMIQRVTSGAKVTDYLAQLNYVFAGVPALVSYDEDGVGEPTEIHYPVKAPDPATNLGGGPGTRENPIPVAPRSSGDVELALTFWRPQREALGQWGEGGEWTDMGNLNYSVGVKESGYWCPQDAYSWEEGQELALPLAPEQVDGAVAPPGFRDLADDRQASTGNTFTYTLNLTRCLEAPVTTVHGVAEPAPITFPPDEPAAFSVVAATDEVDQAQQTVFFNPE